MKFKKHFLCLFLPLQLFASENSLDMTQSEITVNSNLDGNSNQCCDPCATVCDPCCYCFSVQFDVSYFRPNSSKVRDFYGSAWVNYKVEVDIPFSFCCSCFAIFADCSIATAHGNLLAGEGSCASSNSRYRSRMRNIPISLGLKWIQPICGCLNFYLGAGPRYFFTRTRNEYPFIKRHERKNGWGGVVIGGFTYDICWGLFLDAFASWSYMKFGKPSGLPVNVSGRGLQAGGLDIGAGIGWKF